MNHTALLLLVLTVVLYYVSKRLYARFGKVWLGPAILAPILLIAVMVGGDISYATYISDSRWLVWLLGPTTIAFAVPIYEHRDIIRRHAFALIVGVLVAMIVAVGSSFVLARLFELPPEMARSLLARSISTPFALAVSDQVGGSRDLVGLFVIITGFIGMLLGEALLSWLPLRTRMARGAPFGAGAHGFGTAKARQIGSEEGVVASLVMMINGILMVFAAPLLAHLPI
ncbi:MULTISPECIES: LrgB family protein [Pandoraea]|uniref:LrgB n=1 Tax=Pandoraea communis TaxID=2508297 RepID=A0A5E4SCU1_9BURK|nr:MULTISPECIES: LrgB family protein [Pandoraea]EON13910.1 LrgB family protein [Pandoraea sp. SD6-2]VVD73440.1 LrgB [Pandoraea communis]